MWLAREVCVTIWILEVNPSRLQVCNNAEERAWNRGAPGPICAISGRRTDVAPPAQRQALRPSALSFTSPRIGKASTRAVSSRTRRISCRMRRVRKGSGSPFSRRAGFKELHEKRVDGPQQFLEAGSGPSAARSPDLSDGSRAQAHSMTCGWRTNRRSRARHSTASFGLGKRAGRGAFR